VGRVELVVASAGFECDNRMPSVEARKSFTHYVSCTDSHAPDTTALRVTRQVFSTYRAVKTCEVVKRVNVNTFATLERRGAAFARCQRHGEYYQRRAL